MAGTPARYTLVAIALGVAHVAAASGSPEAPADESPLPDKPTSLANLEREGPTDAVGATRKEHLGLKFTSADGRFSINPWLRGQFRFSDPFDEDPRSAADLESPPGSDVELRRARLKVEGHVFDPRVGFYYEQELTGDTPLLDLRLDVEFRDDLLMRLGQYKVLYNRERIDSSGKQQFAERSIATYAFTLDRQIGATLAKHWAVKTNADNWLMIGVFEGDGRGSGQRGDDPMLVARWQWQFLGRALPFSQGDLKFRSAHAATLSFGVARVTGPYTRYSSSGGGQLDGFEAGGDNRYTLEQGLQEFAWHFSGYSLQQEYHVKEIEDRQTGRRSTLRGGYAQLGKAWRVGSGEKSYPVEIAARIAQVDWDSTPADRVQDELTLALNYFIAGHDNKLTLEASRLAVDEPGQRSADDARVRVQWDVSF